MNKWKIQYGKDLNSTMLSLREYLINIKGDKKRNTNIGIK